MGFSLDGIEALVTGASAGLGEEFARQLAPRAKKLWLVARRRDRLAALRDELERAHPGLEVGVLPLDLGAPSAAETTLTWLKREQAALGLLVNNAGLGDYGEFATSDWERVQQLLRVNIEALTALTHRLLPLLRQEAPAGILHVSSLASCAPIPDFAAYAASKAYVTSFSEALRIELQEQGIRVTALCPGPVPTEFGLSSIRPGEELGPDYQKASRRMEISPARAVSAGLRGLEKDRPCVFPGAWVRLMASLLSCLPMWCLRPALSSRPRKRSEEL
ncbi:MAG: SDR family NAD(P)-dependent oxidoreductase [Verrucomicrobiota bacterium]